MALALGIAVAALPVAAQQRQEKLSIREYTRLLDDPEFMREKELGSVGWYLVGMAGGIRWLMANFEHEQARPLFCLPDGALNTRDKHIHSIASEMRRRPDLWRKDSPEPLARLAIAAMRNQFPCR